MTLARSPVRAPALLLAFGLLALATGRAPLAQDRVELADGKVLEGRVVYEDAERIVLRVKTRYQELEAAQVKSVRSVERSLAELLAKIEPGLPADGGACLDLARWAAGRGLAGEASALYWAALAADPGQEVAHQALGHRKVKDAWQVRNGKSGWLPFAELLRERADWSEAWEFASLHYDVRTNLGLATSLAILFDLERFYRAFQAAFGQSLRLYAPEESMHCALHAERKSFPEPGGGRPAYFDVDANRLEMCAEGGLRLDVLFHEATHQILHDTAQQGSKAKGLVPAWLGEGLSEYLAASHGGELGRASFELGKKDEGHFAEHARSKDPYDLSRLLSFQGSDFMASSKSNLKYAQAYTLVHFLLHGGDGRFRPAFVEFLRSVYRGQSSSTDFKNALESVKTSERGCEQAWTEYARAKAGS